MIFEITLEMNFIEKISQSRIQWEAQTSFRIDGVFQYFDETNEVYGLMKNEILSSRFVGNENGIISINRIGLQQYWNSSYSIGSKILLTLLWGVIDKTRNFKISFLSAFDENMNLIYGFDKEFFNKKIEELFEDFERKNKIKGVGYAFFSKFFQYAIPKSSFIICDQWTMKAVASFLISNKMFTELTDIFYLSINKRNQIVIELRKNKGSVCSSYLKFINVFKNITHQLTIFLPQVNNDVLIAEELLFGWDRTIKIKQYDNPRYYYQDVIYSYLNLQQPLKEKLNRKTLQSQKVITKVFIFKQPSNAYYSLRISADSRSKIGYFDNNAWLCLHRDYSHLLKDIEWQEGNTKGGSESQKHKFNSIPELVNKLKENGLDCVYE
jgi:hypothetical protein